MTKMISEFDAITGETIEREATAQELAQWEKDAAVIAAEAELKAQALAKREQAIAKLAVLGLEIDDLKALGLA